MKKFRVAISIVSFIVFIGVMHGCKNVTPPTAPSSNNTPVVYTQTKTATSGATATFTQTAAFTTTVSATRTNTTVSTAVLTVTDTAQYTQTASCTFSVTQTQTFTGTISPTATVTLTTIMDTFTSTITVTGTFTPTISITPTVTLTATATIPSIQNPWGVVYANSNLYVSNFVGLVMKFSTGGTYISTIGSKGTGNGQYNNPYGLATDSSGNIYVTDYTNSRIVEFNSSGGFVQNFGSYGFGSGQLNAPSGVAVDSTGNVFVADTTNANIVEFNSSGGFVRSFGSVDFEAICVDTSNNVYATDTYDHKIYEYSNIGTLIGSFGSAGTGPGQFTALQGITADSSGNIFVSNCCDSINIQEFGPGPSFTYINTYAGSYNNPQNINWNNGIIYIANSGGNDILQLIPTTATPTATATVTVTPTSTAMPISQGMPVTASDSMYGAASNAVDGNFLTDWGASTSYPNWIYVNLGAVYNISEVNIHWFASPATTFYIQSSPDAVTWTNFVTATGPGNNATSTFTGLSASGQYVRVYATDTYGAPGGISIYELQIYGTP